MYTKFARSKEEKWISFPLGVFFLTEFCILLMLCFLLGIGGVFFMVALVCIIQLVMCILSEYQRLKNPTFGKACKVTTQKLLYLVAFLASLLRGAYFTQIVSQFYLLAH